MSDCSQTEACEKHFAGIHTKLDRLDEAVRGNGKPGILIRLDRLEQDARRQGRLLWLLIGAGITVLTSIVIARIAG
jgi:hypothetical protein